MGKGRRNLYDTNIKPNFSEIEKMLNEGASEKQVAEALGVSYPSWNKYKRDFKEFDDLCRKPRRKLVSDLKSALVKRALGMRVTEKKTYIREDADGNKVKYTELTEKELPPDVAAINLGLKNWASDEWANDPQALKLREQELELRKMQLEIDKW